MSLSNDQLTERILAIEEMLNDIQTALNNLVPRKEMIAYTSVRQTEINELESRVTELESQVSTLQG